MSELPSGWADVTLSDVLISVVGGGTPSRNVPAFFKGSIPWFTVKDMKSLRPLDAEEHISELALANSATNLIPANTLIVATRIALGRAMRPTVACAINQDLKALFFGSGVSADFLLYWVGASERIIKDLGSGTTVSGIRLDALNGLPLKLPPAAEQSRIVAKLEELLSDLDAGVVELKAAQRKLAQYRQSLLKAAVEGSLTAEWRKQNAPAETGAQLLERILAERRARWEAQQLAKFEAQGKKPPKDWQKKYPEPVQPDTTDLPVLPEGWVWASVDQLSDFVRNGLSKTPNNDQKGFQILRINAVRPMSVNFGAIKHIEIRESEAEDYWVEEGDVLATRYNGSVDLLGVFGMVRGVHERTLHPDKLVRMKPVTGGKLGAWMEVCGNVGFSRKHLVARVKTTAGQTGISGSDLKKTPIPLAPAAEQDMTLTVLNERLEAVKELEQPIEHSLNQSAAQRQNILRAAFAGQLVPQDPNDEPASVLLERIRAERAAQAPARKPRGQKTRKAVA